MSGPQVLQLSRTEGDRDNRQPEPPPQSAQTAVRSWLHNATPTIWIRHFIYLLGSLLLLIGGSAVWVLQSHESKVNRLTFVVVPAIHANDLVFETMSEADKALLGYQIAHDPKLLTASRDARRRTVVALAKLEDLYKLFSASGYDETDNALHKSLMDRQSLAVQKWLSYALSTEQAVSGGKRIDILQGATLFDSFRLANTEIDEEIKFDNVGFEGGINSIAQMRAIIVATLVAFLATLLLGMRYSRSVSGPINRLRDTMTRQRAGDLSARASEDFGSLEIRSLAQDFNTLAERNLSVQRRVEMESARLASMVDISLALGQELSLSDLLTLIVESARTVLGARYAALGVLNMTHTGLAEFVTAGLSDAEKAAIGRLPHGMGLLGALIDDPQALRLTHITDDPRSVGFPLHHPPMDSFLGVPIVIHGVVFGNLYLTDKVDGPFTAEDEQVAHSFALLVAVAIENINRYEDELRLVKMLESVREIESAIRLAPDLQQLLNVVCVKLGETLGVDRVIIKTVDAEYKATGDAEWHVPDLRSARDFLSKLSLKRSGFFGDLWRTAHPLGIDDFLVAEVQSDERAQDFYKETGARSVIFSPIGVVDRVIGSIFVIKVDQPYQWLESEIKLVSQVASSVSQMIVESEYRAHLRDHIKRLEQLENQKTTFVETVSHELRTPLTSISGYLEILQDPNNGALSDEQRRMLIVMNRNTNRLRGLIEDLLVLNQSESDGPQVHIADVPMCELIADTCIELTLLAQSRAIEFDLESGPQNAIVRGDRGRIHSVVVNVISNAIKFSHLGGVVTVRCTLDESTGRIRFSCQDRGIGIPVADQGELFTRFYRASNATERVIPGTGLGLTIVKQIVEDHGGQVRLASVEGEGTTVVIDLPVFV